MPTVVQSRAKDLQPNGRFDIHSDDGPILMSGQDALLSKLNAVRTEEGLVDFLQRLSEYFGFMGFMLLSIPAVADEQLSGKIELSNLPCGLIDSYDKLGLLKNSQTFEMLRRSTVPFTMDTQTVNAKRASESAKAAIRLFAEYNITRSAFIPVHGPHGARASLGFLGNRSDLTHTELGDLAIFAAHAYNIYSNLKNDLVLPENLLSPRQIEILHWAANGKTSGEIASILSLSEHTVNTYMNTAIRKLDCVNRVQVVAKALRMRLIG